MSMQADFCAHMLMFTAQRDHRRCARSQKSSTRQDHYFLRGSQHCLVPINFVYYYSVSP